MQLGLVTCCRTLICGTGADEGRKRGAEEKAAEVSEGELYRRYLHGLGRSRLDLIATTDQHFLFCFCLSEL